jgi:hypothetical protein
MLSNRPTYHIELFDANKWWHINTRENGELAKKIAKEYKAMTKKRVRVVYRAPKKTDFSDSNYQKALDLGIF